ncbi:MAG: hypothetical protein ABIQ88_14635 [Chitinophagaceae bacterium]
MKTRLLISIFATMVFTTACKEQNKSEHKDLVIGGGKMPALANDSAGNQFIVFGSGDSILFASSHDAGHSFSTPEVVAVLPQLVASSMRGPQIASTANGLAVIAVNKQGDIFSFYKADAGPWAQAVKVNDIDTVAKEGLMALSADGNNAFAVWLDLRDKHNKIVGAKSTDGGKSWSKNVLVYASPDTTVCECCKPSVALNGKNVYVMFRNHLQGNRDLHLIQSVNGGIDFGGAQQLGKENWALDGCPMDGGGLVISSNGVPETVWRRKNTIYACTAGKPETAIGEGKGCTIESVNNKNVYAWTQNGEVIIRTPNGTKVNLGKGQLPLLKRVNNEHVLCVWENDKHIHAEMIAL